MALVLMYLYFCGGSEIKKRENEKERKVSISILGLYQLFQFVYLICRKELIST